MEVHNEMNWGLLEPVYNEALHLELLDRGIHNEREKALPCYYKHHLLEKHYQMDIVVDDIILELKSVSEINSAHRAQLFNYMRITNMNRGVLLNFGEKSLRAERYLYLPEDDNFILLTETNYRNYIDS